jgi:hypothetical protein
MYCNLEMIAIESVAYKMLFELCLAPYQIEHVNNIAYH